MGGQSAGHGDALRLAAGQSARLGAVVVGEAHAVQPLRGLFTRLGLGHAVAARSEGDVVQGAQVGEEEVVLEDHADRPGLGGRAVQRVAVQVEMTARQRCESGQGAQGCGLAGAVRTEQRDHVAGGGAQCDVEAEGAAVDDEVGVQAVGAHVVGRDAAGDVVDVRHEAVIRGSDGPARTVWGRGRS